MGWVCWMELRESPTEVSKESEGQQRDGGDTRHELPEKKWMRNDSEEKVDGVKQKLWAEFRRTTGEGVSEQRKPTEDGETAKSQGKAAVECSAIGAPICLRAPAQALFLLHMPSDDIHQDARVAACLGQKPQLQLCILRVVWCLVELHFLLTDCFTVAPVLLSCARLAHLFLVAFFGQNLVHFLPLKQF